MSKKLDKTRAVRASEIIKLIIAGFEKILKAAEQYVQFIDDESTGKKTILEAAATQGVQLSRVMLNRLEQVGRHQVHWRLLPNWGDGHTSKIRQLPFSEQKEIYENNKKYPLLLPEGAENLMVDVRKVSSDQAKQLLADGYIRDLAEQKSYLVDNSPVDSEPIEVVDPYRITAKGLLLPPHGNSLLISKSKLKEILMQL